MGILRVLLLRHNPDIFLTPTFQLDPLFVEAAIEISNFLADLQEIEMLMKTLKGNFEND